MGTLEGQQKIDRFKIGTGSDSTLKLKTTEPGVMVVKLTDPPPSKPQETVRMGVGGSKATMRHKGRVDPKAAREMDPGASPVGSTKVNWPTADKKAQRGYVVGKGWPSPKFAGESSQVTAAHP